MDAFEKSLKTPPPRVDKPLVGRIAQDEYGLAGIITPLSGERDANYLITDETAGRIVLKFINPSESLEETKSQIEVLEHLASTGANALTPRAIRTRTHAPYCQVDTDDTEQVRVRAYNFLDGIPGTNTGTSTPLRTNIGRAIATLDVALETFYHPGADRSLSWNIVNLPSLKPYIAAGRGMPLESTIRDYLEYFAGQVAPKLDKLPKQVIHNDLSPSNYLVARDDSTKPCGVLDFGDIVYAPRVVDLAITASYQMADAAGGLSAITEVAKGYGQISPLTPSEADILYDLVRARLVQRIVITHWRAEQFPENKTYILRGQADAVRQLQRLVETKARGQHIVSSIQG